MQPPSLPFKVLALAPLTPDAASAKHQEPVPIDRENVGKAMEALGITLSVSLPRQLCPEGSLTLHLRQMKDFHPDGLVRNTPFLNNLLEARRFVEEAPGKGLSEDEVFERLKGWPDLSLDISFGKKTPKAGAGSPVDDILKMVAMPGEDPSLTEDTRPVVTQIDSRLQQVLHRIVSDDSFRTLESAWQGISLFLKQGGANGEVSVEIIPASIESLEETLDHLMPRLIGELPSLILVDLPFDNSSRSLALLEKIALLSDTLLVPALCWVTPKFFLLDGWGNLGKLPYLPNHLDEPVFAKWRHFRGTPPARWVAVSCNRFLPRYPYGPDNRPALVRFEESQALWISPVWAMASLIGQSVRKTGWPTRFTDWQTVRLEGLPLRSIEGGKQVPLETSFSEDRIVQFLKAGFTPLVSLLNKDIAFFPGEATVAGGSIAYQLFLSRITQLLLWCRDSFPKDLEPLDLEKRLEKMITLFWERLGLPGPNRLDISIDRPPPDGAPIARILVQPSRQVLPSGETVELAFPW